jgi:hypothetical protein
MFFFFRLLIPSDLFMPSTFVRLLSSPPCAYVAAFPLSAPSSPAFPFIPVNKDLPFLCLSPSFLPSFSHCWDVGEF